MPGRFKKQHDYFCPPPPLRGIEGDETCGADKIRSALGMEYCKPLHYAIAHLRRADGALRPKREGVPGCSMDLLSAGEHRYGSTDLCFTLLTTVTKGQDLCRTGTHCAKPTPSTATGSSRRITCPSGNSCLLSAPNLCQTRQTGLVSSCRSRQICTPQTTNCF
jgi:hypothetical protein